MNISQLEMKIFTENLESHPVTELEHANEQDIGDGTQLSETLGCFDPVVNNAQGYDMGIDFGIGRKQVLSHDKQLSGEMLDDEYRCMIQTLNEKQKHYFYHGLYYVKTSNEPIYNFLSGKAGIGKGVLLKALYQALIKLFFTHAR